MLLKDGVEVAFQLGLLQDKVGQGCQSFFASDAGACFALLGLLGIFVARPDKAQGQAGMRLVQTSPLWKRFANPPLSREAFLQKARLLGLGDFEKEPIWMTLRLWLIAWMAGGRVPCQTKSA